MKFYYVYLLHLHNGTIYTGFTRNLKQRLENHKNGHVRSTKAYRPIKLVHYEAYTIQSDAERRERFLKTSEGKRLLKQQIRDLYSTIRR